MREEYLEIFNEEFGEPTYRRQANKAVIAKYRGILPRPLISFWENEGWNGYANGLFWIVNPDEYQHHVDMWLEGTPFKNIDKYHAIARSAFGKIYVWGERYNRKVTISPLYHVITALPEEVKTRADDPDRRMRIFLSGYKEDFDIEDENEELLFESALEKLGPCGPNEMYAFEPALVLGGSDKLENLRKLNMEVHLNILREFSSARYPEGIE